MELLLVVAVALGAFAQGATGIGFGLLVAPVAALVLPADEVVGTVARLGLVVDLVLVAQGRAAVQGRTVRNYLAPAVLAVPVAAAALAVVPDAVVVVAVVAATLAGTATLLTARPAPATAAVAPALAPQLVAGFAAGFMGVAAGMPGPPVAVEAARRHVPPAQARATLALFFAFVDAAAVVIHPQAVPLGTTGVLVAALAAGLAAAAGLGHRLPAAVVRRALVAVIVASALAALVRLAT